jgi:uncharacterized protein (DUF2267 family)
MHWIPLFGGLGHASCDPDAELVQVGDRWVPPVIVIKAMGSATEPDLRMKIEVRDGIPVCTEVSLQARAEGPEIRSKDLRDILLDDWMQNTVAAFSADQSGTAGARCTITRRDALANVEQARKGRPRISREQLQNVANVYRQHIDARPTDAVRRAFGFSSHRTAARYVERARKLGLLPETDPGKKKA